MDEAASARGMSGGPPVRRAEIRHVPAAGISVFTDPDASVAPIRELSAGYELTVVGRRPPWVHVQSGDGLDGWVDGTQLAGVATGAPPVNGHVPVPDVGGPVEAGYRVALVEKQPSSVLVATGPVVGAIGGLLAIFGAAFPWQQAVASRLEVDAFGIPVRFLTGWDQLTKGGLSIGWLIVVLAGIGAVFSMISGGGIVRRILGLAIIVICGVYVLQQQDWLTTNARGLGTGINVWDIVDYGVLITFGGGLVMLLAPSR